jgi:small GTP-binding protein
MEEVLTITIKAIMCGESGVGKTCIIQHMAGHDFDPKQRSTIGVDFIVRCFSPSPPSSRRYKLQLWDTCGQERFAKLVEPYFRNSQLILFVFDLSRKESFHAIEKWRDRASWVMHSKDSGTYASTHTLNARAVLIGNKTDRTQEREVSHEEAALYAHAHNMSYFETSAQTGAGIKDEFQAIVNEMDVYDQKCEVESGKHVYNTREMQMPNESETDALIILEDGLELLETRRLVHRKNVCGGDGC